MLRGKSVIEDSDTLLAKGLIPIIDLAHCGMNYFINILSSLA